MAHAVTLPDRLRAAFRGLLAPEDRTGQYVAQLRAEVTALRAELQEVRQAAAASAQAAAGTAAELPVITARIAAGEARASLLSCELRGDYYRRTDGPSPKEYWTGHNVTAHHRFTSIEDSLRQLEFRNRQYPGYIELLPVAGKDGMAVLDYGCGPGHDLVGFAHYSRPARLVGVDLSPVSLAEAEARLQLHGAAAELVQVEYGDYELAFGSATFDYIHCSGVLMCVEDPLRLLREFGRLLKPGGELRLMVYNWDSIWVHLYVAYIVQIENGLYTDLPTRTAFTRTTDGEDCPVNAVWRSAEMLALGREAGFEPEFLGAAVSLWEMHVLPRRHLACLQPLLPDESRAFLLELRLDSEGQPLYRGHRAGIDGCYRLRRPG
ncbi:MAG: class I SAM-dependent methyltransferase [Alphaproteobacteria bacterium]|nr:class I SAM-dependent methyltransferase [Alphaproteobacteria bacterium]